MLRILSRGPNPVGLSIARKFFRIYDEEHDAVIQLLLDAALADIERYTRQTFALTRFEFQGTLDGYKTAFTFPRFPVAELIEVYSLARSEAFDLTDFAIDNERLPPILSGELIGPLRITWDAGLTCVAADLQLLILERALDSFEAPGAESRFSNGGAFRPQHKLMLEGLTSHHDAVR